VSVQIDVDTLVEGELEAWGYERAEVGLEVLHAQRRVLAGRGAA